MVTLLPSPIFSRTAQVLKTEHLDHQRETIYRLMEELLTHSGNTESPLHSMWRTYEWSLLQLQSAVTTEFYFRGYNEKIWGETLDLYLDHVGLGEQRANPPWLGDHYFHLSHQSYLVGQDAWHYAPHFPSVPLGLEFYWPL